ncbi:hypothetical protein ACH4PR_47935 [Streptomyces mirabilis]
MDETRSPSAELTDAERALIEHLRFGDEDPRKSPGLLSFLT